jgi:hypothetical protein
MVVAIDAAVQYIYVGRSMSNGYGVPATPATDDHPR